MHPNYLPTVDITNDVHARLLSGELRLRRGQWIRINGSERRARWAGIMPRSGVMYVQHWEGALHRWNPKRFQLLCDCTRAAQAEHTTA
jgi:hypothetical protein